MAVILGNLLDNSVNAVAKLEGDRSIQLRIKYTKGRLILRIDNPFEGEVLIRNKTILTTHSDASNHGIGLESVKLVLQKYDGSMAIQQENNIFSVTILIYID